MDQLLPHYGNSSNPGGDQDYLPFSEGDLVAIENADWTSVNARQGTATSMGSCTLFREGAQLGDVVATLSKKTPANEYGLPIFFYRSDILASSNILQQGFIPDEDATAAIVPIAYEDGYPTMPNGTPWWYQMDHEPLPAYTLFKCFLEQAEQEGIRILANLAAQQNVPAEVMSQTSMEFYWTARARAYDLFIVAAEAKRREHRIRKTENYHFEQADKLLKPILDRFNSNPDLVEGLSAMEMLEFFERLHKIQRTSLGLTGQQSSTNKDAPSPGSSVEVILRSLTKNSGLTEQGQEAIGSRIQAMLANPEMAIMAQEMVIRATTNNAQ